MARPGVDVEKVAKIQSLRRTGFSFADIAQALGLPKSTVIYHCSSIPINKNGHRKLLRTLADLAVALEPGKPFKEPPLPNFLVAKLRRLTEIMQKS